MIVQEYKVVMKQLAIRLFFQISIYFCIFILLFVFGTSYILSEKLTFMDVVGLVVEIVISGLYMFCLNKSKITRNY